MMAPPEAEAAFLFTGNVANKRVPTIMPTER
jgi:hypothetical protein